MKLLSRPMPDPPPGARVEVVRVQIDTARSRADRAIARADAVLEALARTERIRQAYANVKLRRRPDVR